MEELHAWKALCARVVQLAERGAHNAEVGSSILPPSTDMMEENFMEENFMTESEYLWDTISNQIEIDLDGSIQHQASAKDNFEEAGECFDILLACIEDNICQEVIDGDAYDLINWEEVRDDYYATVMHPLFEKQMNEEDEIYVD